MNKFMGLAFSARSAISSVMKTGFVTMLQKAKKTIEKYNMLSFGDRVGIGVSGGPDSVALLHLMARVAKNYGLALVIIHLNHGLRGKESDREEEFVQELGESMKISVESTKVNIPLIKEKEKGSLENICRKERYKYFTQVAKNLHIGKIALGHNLNDQAETIVMKFLRGSGLEGLKGILPVRDAIYIRPLIEVTRDEILLFLESEGIKYITDSSNTNNTYLRNRIRNILIPELKNRYNPRFVESISHTSNIIRMENEFIKNSVDRILSKWNINFKEKKVNMEIPEFKKLHPALQSRIIKTLLENCSPAKTEIGFKHVESVIDLIEDGRPNGLLDLPFGVKVRREYSNLIILGGKESDAETGKSLQTTEKNKGIYGDDKWEANDYYYNVAIPGRVDIKEIGMSVAFDIIYDKGRLDFKSDDTVFMDYETVSFPLIIRNIRPGDRIQPLGIEGRKKVSSIFIDEKIPMIKRKKIPLLVDQKSVLWISGIKLSNRVKITDATEKILRAEII